MTEAGIRPSDSIIFPLSELDKGIADLISGMPASPRWPAMQAINHLNRAWKIRTADPEMAIFRSITAEEEAVTALFLSLKRRRYDGAEKINHRDHVHKNALFPFFSAITRVITKVRHQIPSINISIDRSKEEPVLELGIEIKNPSTGQIIWGCPIPPLHFSLFGGPEKEAKKKEDFSAGIKEMLSASNMKNMTDYVRNRANKRNQLLYANATGCPSFRGDIEKELQLYRRNVFIILKIYLLVDPYAEKQLFVQQALHGYLKALKLLPSEFDF